MYVGIVYRLTIKASCPMYLQTFPMDTQTCRLELGSREFASHHSFDYS